jgi:hypothetical protein
VAKIGPHQLEGVTGTGKPDVRLTIYISFVSAFVVQKIWRWWEDCTTCGSSKILRGNWIKAFGSYQIRLLFSSVIKNLPKKALQRRF